MNLEKYSKLKLKLLGGVNKKRNQIKDNTTLYMFVGLVYELELANTPFLMEDLECNRQFLYTCRKQHAEKKKESKVYMLSYDEIYKSFK